MLALSSKPEILTFTEGGLGGDGEEGKLLKLTDRLLQDEYNNQLYDKIKSTFIKPITSEMLTNSQSALKRMKENTNFETTIQSNRFYFDNKDNQHHISYTNAQKIFTDAWGGNGEDYTKAQLNDALMFAISAINDTNNLLLPNNTTDPKIKKAYNEIFAEIFTAVKDSATTTTTTNKLITKLKTYGSKNKKPLDPEKDLLRIKKLVRTPIKYINNTKSNLTSGEQTAINLTTAKSEISKIFADTKINNKSHRPLAALCKILNDNHNKTDSENILKKYYIHELHKFGRKNKDAKTMCETIDLILSNRWGLKRKRDTVKRFFKRGK